MGKNEIRLRRNNMSAGRIARHRNYADLMQRHERDTKLRRILKVFTYFLVILFIIIILIIVIRWEKRSEQKSSSHTKTVQTDFIPKQT